MSDPSEEFAVALKELQQVSETIRQGAAYFEAQAQSGQAIASVTEGAKEYIKEVLPATTQHLLNVADIVDGALIDQTAAICQLNNASKAMLQNMIAVQARTEAQYLSALQTPISYHRFPKTYNPIGRL